MTYLLKKNTDFESNWTKVDSNKKMRSFVMILIVVN